MPIFKDVFQDSLFLRLMFVENGAVHCSFGQRLHQQKPDLLLAAGEQPLAKCLCTLEDRQLRHSRVPRNLFVLLSVSSLSLVWSRPTMFINMCSAKSGSPMSLPSSQNGGHLEHALLVLR